MAAPYRVEHTTKYVHASAVAMSQHVAYLRPRELPCQHVGHHELTIEPSPASSPRGVLLGGAHHRLFVGVSVVPLDELPISSSVRLGWAAGLILPRPESDGVL
jgi:hypothetical protein